MRVFRAALSTAFAAGALVFAITECGIWDDVTLPPKDSGAADGTPSGPQCDHAGLPTNPGGADNTGGTAFVTVMKTVLFGGDPKLDAGGADGGELFGFDLDDNCTCPQEPSCLRKGATCDDTKGRDNFAAALVRVLAGDYFDLNQKADENIALGRLNMLFLVQDYNGQDDDPNVFLSLIVSRGHYEADGGRTPPRFTADDPWSIDSAHVTIQPSGTGPRKVFDVVVPGFVRGRQLVADYGDKGAFVLGGITMKLTDVKIIADIVPTDAGSFMLSGGTIGGRWPTKEALQALRGLDFGGGVPPLCQGAIFETVKDQLCAQIDIAANKADDNQGKPCDAMSTAIRFVGALGAIGEPREDLEPVPCPPADAGDFVCPP